jgi:hypothetical protein
LVYNMVAHILPILLTVLGLDSLLEACFWLDARDLTWSNMTFTMLDSDRYPQPSELQGGDYKTIKPHYFNITSQPLVQVNSSLVWLEISPSSIIIAQTDEHLYFFCSLLICITCTQSPAKYQNLPHCTYSTTNSTSSDHNWALDGANTDLTHSQHLTPCLSHC